MARPCAGAEAGLGGLGERPHAEVLRARHALAMPVISVFRDLERKPQRIDIEPAALRGVWGDDSDGCDEENVHATIQALNAGIVLYETDTYREWAPPAALRHAISCLWVRRGDGSNVRVLPDGCA